MPRFSVNGKVYVLPEGTTPDQAMRMITSMTTGKAAASPNLQVQSPGPSVEFTPDQLAANNWKIPPAVQAARDAQALNIRRREVTKPEAMSYAAMLGKELFRKAPMSGEQRTLLKNELATMTDILDPLVEK